MVSDIADQQHVDDPEVWTTGPEGELIPDYESTFPTINEGEVVHGTVVRVDKAEVLVIAVDDQDASVKIAELATRHYPNVKVFARARNRQHAFRLMEAGAPYIIRETYLSSLDMAEQVLEWLGDEPAAARRSVALFRAHDEATMQQQYEIHADDDKFLATTRASAVQLESLFESDKQDESR